jgi:DNA-damage-inducible protein D
MKKEQIQYLFVQFENARHDYNGIECWSARELQLIFNYKEWRNFLKVVDKAVNSCKGSGNAVSDHFVEFNKMVSLGSNSERKVNDIALTRYACYLIAQNGDPAKPEIAFAQTYFAVQTRKQELIEQRILDVARINARKKLSKSEKKLSTIIYERGFDEKGFASIRSKGDKALFGGFTTNDMKKKLQVPDNRPLADFLPTLTISAKDFATELTSHNITEKNLTSKQVIIDEHIENNTAVRKILLRRGIQPEELPPAEDLKKVKRRLDGDKKHVLKEAKPKNKK